MVQTICLLLVCYLQNNLLTQAKTQTEARNDTEGDKTLIATYTDERELEKADSLLQTLPQETPDDIAFYDFFAAYIDELQSNTDLLPYDGKAPSQAALQIQNMATPATPPNHAALFAQTVFAAQQNLAYQRIPKDMQSETDINKQTQLPIIKFVPNPSKDFIYLFIDMPHSEGQVRIYNAMGMPVLTLKITDKYTSLNTANLSNGVYFCEFAASNGVCTVGKFSILR
ncbi:hypothetical protein C7N43_22040 [Sphingobacteriales bacterium UPWRP_1]|nr:hypothetical protein C7N43_22040 [Sphingobacteriales bacterium UPWRP_1]